MLPLLVCSVIAPDPLLFLDARVQAAHADFLRKDAQFRARQAADAARTREVDASIERSKALIAECYRLVDQLEARQKARRQAEAQKPAVPMPPPDPRR